MTIQQIKEDEKLTLELGGRLDTASAPQLEEVLDASLEGVKELDFDLKDLEYLSSAGLRLLLSAQKKMSKAGSMKVTHVNDVIMEIFEVTGFTDILTIENDA